jgi:ApaG protein
MLPIIDTIEIKIVTAFIADQSIENQQYVFSYTITIANKDKQQLQLISRRWLITDANGDVSTVEGEGVIGKQPILATGQHFTYTSGCVLKTPLGSMQGFYTFRDQSGQLFKAPIHIFTLAKPNVVN